MSDYCFEQVMDDICEDILQAEDLPEIKFAVQYPKTPKDVPLKYNTVALGIKSITTNNIYSSNLLSRKEGGFIKSGSLKLTLSIDIYAPNKNGGKTCYEIYEKILDRLIFSSSHKVDRTDCEQLTYNRTTGAYVMKTTAVFDILVKRESESVVQSISASEVENGN